MDIDVILKLLTVGGIPTLIAGAFVWLVRTGGLAIVAELQGLRQEVKALRQDFAWIQGRLLGTRETPLPVSPPPIATPVDTPPAPSGAVAKGAT